ncbi:MAG: hypothetical protein WC776_05050 [Patescibacteria group bacterium]|jgi:hypothetical protein
MIKYALQKAIDNEHIDPSSIKLKEPTHDCLERIIHKAILRGQGQWKTLGYYLQKEKKEVLLKTLRHFPSQYAEWAVQQMTDDFIKQMETRQKSKVSAISDEVYRRVLYQVFKGHSNEPNDDVRSLAVQVIGRTQTQLIVREVPMDLNNKIGPDWVVRWSDVRAFNRLTDQEKASVEPMTKRFHWIGDWIGYNAIRAGYWTLRLVTEETERRRQRS